MKVAFECRLKYRHSHASLDFVAGHQRGDDVLAAGIQLFRQREYGRVDDDAGVSTTPGAVMLELAA